jgi:hypothetical protein
MSKVLDFPTLLTGPTADGHRDRLHADAFRDLEGRLCDCVRMAHIAQDLAVNAKDADEHMAFAIVHGDPSR